MRKIKTISRITLFALFSVLFSVLIIGTRAEAAGKVHALVINGLDTDSLSSLASTKTFYNNLKNSRVPDYQIKEENIKLRTWETPKNHYLADGTTPFTTANFETWLNLAFGHNEPDSLNIFYYAGHTTSDPSGDPQTYGIQVGPNTHTEYDDNVYRYTKLAEKLATYKGHFIVILDACFVENFYTRGVKPNNLQSKFTCILSSAEGVKSRFDDFFSLSFSSKKMLFTSRMNDGVKWKALGKVYNADSNSDGVINTTEMFNYGKSLFINVVQAPKLYPEKGKAYPLIQLDTISSLSKTSATLWVGDGIEEKYTQVKLKPTLKLNSSKVKVQYVSSDSSIASVGKTTGVITARSAGTANITAYLADANGNRCFGTEKKCKVTVKQALTTLNKSSIRINKGDTYQLEATVTGPTNKVTWKSSDKSVATVSSDGLVTGVKVGTTTITATANGIPATCKVTVVNIPSDAIKYNRRYYKRYDEALSWGKASTACKNVGGHLMTITSSGEQNVLFNLGLRSRTNYWLGGRDTATEGVWKWITGEKWSFTAWGNNQPDDTQQVTGIAEDYLQVVTDWSCRWNDSASVQDNTAAIGYICEWEPLSN